MRYPCTGKGGKKECKEILQLLKGLVQILCKRALETKEAPSHRWTEPPLLFLNLLFYQHALVGLADNKNIILIAG